MAQRLDLDRQALTGDPVTLADSVAFDANTSAPAVSVSAAGLLAYRTGGSHTRQLTWFDRSGKVLGVVGAPDENSLSAPRVSPDGRRVAVHRTLQGYTDIWLLDGPRTIRFTFNPAFDAFANWSPDGSRIVFESSRTGQRHLYQKSSSGSGTEELLVQSQQNKGATDWSANGRFVLYNSADPQTDRDIWVLPMMEGDRQPWVFLKTSFEERWAQFSPDGQWVVYMSNESGRREIYIRAFARPGASGGAANSGALWQVSTVGGIFPRWGPHGNELYYIGPSGEMVAVPIRASTTGIEPGTPTALFRTRIVGGGVDNAQGLQYDVTRDGRFLINTELDSAAAPITLLQNWNPEAKK